MYDVRVDRSAELRMPTIAVPVRLAVVGHEPQPGELFVADTPRRGRSQLADDLATLLADPATLFVPARWEGPRVRLLGLHAVAWIALHRRAPQPAEPRSTEFPEEISDVFTLYDRQHRVEVELAHGAAVSGLLLDSAPADRPRVGDHLNRAGRFLRLYTLDEHLLINTAQIVSVTELPTEGT